MGNSLNAISADEDKYIHRCKILNVKPQEDKDPYSLHAEWVDETFWAKTQDSWEEYQKSGQIKKLDRAIKVKQAIVDQQQTELNVLIEYRKTM